jgi:hypothetical protein
MVLGLAAPAFAATTVTAVSPGSGPTDCVVGITGTGFTSFQQTDQDLVFVGPAAGIGDDVTVAQADWFALSATEIWAVVPTLVPGTTYTVQVVDPSGTNTAGGSFLSTTGAGGCAPTIASFAPTCGAAGTVVTITGTNLLGPNLTGGDVFFNPYSAAANQPVPDMSEPTSIQAIVPSGTLDGPIRVTTFSTTGGTVFSTADFDVPPPDCKPAGGVEHARTVTLSLRKHLVARGTVSADPELAECISGVKVKIQRKKGGAWKSVGTATTNDAGAYKKRIKDKPGKYRARIGKLSIGDPVTDVCLGDKSPVVRHSHGR